jgi:hypothetical protein
MLAAPRPPFVLAAMSYWPHDLLLELPFLIALLLRRSPLAAVSLLASSTVVLFASILFSTTTGYFTGQVRPTGYEVPTAEFDNLDPELRCYWGAGGCIVGPVDTFTSDIQLATLSTLSALCA